MKYNITELDKSTLLQKDLKYKYRLYVIDKNESVVDMLESVQSIGNYNIDSEADVRRTASFILLLDKKYSAKHIESQINLWIGYDFKLEIGIFNMRKDDYVWYECGYYTITSTNTAYDASNNSLSTDISDWFSKLDGTRNGQIGGAPTITIPNMDDNGNKITIREATAGVLKDSGINKHILQDVGEFYGMEEVNDDYVSYRENNPDWNKLPYDLEYNCGCNTSDILTDIRDLYPNNEMYFDVYNNFCFGIIPSCDNDQIALDNDFIQKILAGDNSESVTYDVPSIKNVTEVLGKSYDVDNYCETVTVSSYIYNLTLSSYTSYAGGTIIAFVAPSDNIDSMKIKVNNLDAIPIYHEYTSTYISKGTIKKGTTYCVKIAYVNAEYVAYFLGQFQPHALCVLTSDMNDTTYTKEYFQNTYNCKNVVFRLEEDNPFTIQRIGIVLDTKSGEEFDNILSDSIAIENAVYYNKKSSSCNDIVTITTKMIPFLDVNIKVSYKKQQEEEIHEYIIKSVSNDLGDMTSSITMERFHPLYFE